MTNLRLRNDRTPQSFFAAAAGSRWLLLAAVLLVSNVAKATDFYVSPNGSSGGSGSMGSPWDIRTACTPASAVHPGDTVWIRGGSYGSGGTTSINCVLAGNSTQPVIIRAYPGERATISGGLGIYGNYAWYWGLEITNNWTRSTGDCGSFPSIKAADGVFFAQGTTGVKLINMVVHDAANGISDQQEAIGTEDYGNIVYNNGWYSSCDRGHGHALYLQNNASSVKLVQDNIGWNSFDIGMQAYGGTGINHLHFVGNVMFNNGVPGGHRVDNFLVQGGGSIPKFDILFQDNVAYNPLDASPGEAGYNQMNDGSNIDLTMTHNYWIGATPTGYVTLMIQGWQTMSMTNNVIVGPMSLANIGTYNWSGNTYYNSAPPSGVDSGSPVIGHNPTGVNVIVRPNKYETGRAHIIVMNWDKTPSVSVNLSQAGLPVGASYEIRDAQNFYGSPVVTGTYNGGSITLPMNLSAVSQIVNYTTPPHTSAEFGTFVLLPIGSVSGSPSPTPTPTPTPVSISVSPSSATLTAGQSQQFVATVGGTTNTGVVWTVPSGTGSVSSSGVYTAPSSISTQQPATVTATSLADSSKAASVSITLNPTVSITPAAGVAGMWSFDTADISGSLALDRSGNGLNGTISNATATTGAVNQALSFNGVSSVVTVADNPHLQLTGSMTISTWLKTTNTSRTEDVLGKYDASGSEYGYILKTLPAGVVGLRLGGFNVSGTRDIADTTRVNDGQWHHVAVVINLGSNVQFYIDGTLRSTQPVASLAASNTAPLWIGTIPFNYFGMPFTGSLDGVRIDSGALSASAIAQLAAGGTTPVAPPPATVSVSVSPSSASLTAGQSQQLTASVSGSSNTAVVWTVPSGLGSVTASGLYTAPSSISSQQTIAVTAASQADGSKSATVSVTLVPPVSAVPPTAGLVGSWSFDSADLSGSLALDRSGNGFNGVYSNTTLVTGKVNQAFSFNGVNSVVTISDNSMLELLNSMTLSAWIKTTNNSRTEDFLGKYDASGTEWGYILKTLPSGAIALRVGGNNVSNTRDVADSTPINDGQWHHVAVVINLGQNVQFYIDGTLRSTQGMITKASPNAAPLWIGTIPFNYFGMPFTGSLDSLRIDGQALSASAIAQLAGGTVTVPPATVAVTVAPVNVTLNPAQTQQFTATVTGSSNTAVTWSVPSGIGSVSASGVYTAPSTVATAQSVTVVATSQADPTKSGSATIGLNASSGGTTTAAGAAGLWSFDAADISGSLAIDRSGNALNGAISGATQVAGHTNQALSFNGSNSVVMVSVSQKIQMLNSMTISTWIKTTNNSRTEDVLGNYDASGTEWGYILKSLPSGVIGLRVGGNNVAGSRDVADTTVINNGQWHHVAVVINLGQNVQFYIDGTLRSTQPMVTLPAPNNAPLWIGTIPFTYFGMPFTGSLDSMRIDAQALSGAAIQQLAM